MTSAQRWGHSMLIIWPVIWQPSYSPITSLDLYILLPTLDQPVCWCSWRVWSDAGGNRFQELEVSCRKIPAETGVNRINSVWFRRHGRPVQPHASDTSEMQCARSWLTAAAKLVDLIEDRSRTRCGFSGLTALGAKDRVMPSFFLAETLKYLYLIFDEKNFANEGYVFSTEGHPFSPKQIAGFSQSRQYVDDRWSVSEPFCPRVKQGGCRWASYHPNFIDEVSN